MAVVGGGFAGVAAAFRTLEEANARGRAVELTLIDGAGVGGGASGRRGGTAASVHAAREDDLARRGGRGEGEAVARRGGARGGRYGRDGRRKER